MGGRLIHGIDLYTGKYGNYFSVILHLTPNAALCYIVHVNLREFLSNVIHCCVCHLSVISSLSLVILVVFFFSDNSCGSSRNKPLEPMYM